MDAKLIEKLRQKYTKNPPEGMTPSLVKNMTDSDLLDMHYFLTEDDDLDDDEFEEGTSDWSVETGGYGKEPHYGSCTRVRRKSNFPIVKKRGLFKPSLMCIFV